MQGAISQNCQGEREGTAAKKIGLAMQLSQGQDRQPLSPKRAHPPAVHDARVRREDAQKRSPLYVSRVPMSTLFLYPFRCNSLKFCTVCHSGAED